MRFDVTPGPVALLELVLDLGSAGSTNQPECPLARSNACVDAQCCGIAANLRKLLVAQ
jgi:hypothetical protein